MMKPTLAETSYLYLSLDRLTIDIRPEGFDLEIMLCVSEAENFPKFLTLVSSVWQPHIPLLKHWHLTHVAQQQKPPVVARGWQQLHLAFITEAQTQDLYLIFCLNSTYWNINRRVSFLYCRILYCTYQDSMIMTLFLARELIRQF